MKILSIVIAAVTLALVSASPTPTQARSRVHVDFGYYGPGLNIQIGRYPRYRYYGHHYRPYYRPYRYRRHRYRSYRRRSYGNRCARWSRRCARSWGTRNRNYYGCMRYHRCR